MLAADALDDSVKVATNWSESDMPGILPLWDEGAERAALVGCLASKSVRWRCFSPVHVSDGILSEQSVSLQVARSQCSQVTCM